MSALVAGQYYVILLICFSDFSNYYHEDCYSFYILYSFFRTIQNIYCVQYTMNFSKNTNLHPYFVLIHNKQFNHERRELNLVQRVYGAALDLFFKTLLEPLCWFIGFKHLVMQEHVETLVCSMLLQRLCYLYRKILFLGANLRKSQVEYYAMF